MHGLARIVANVATRRSYQSCNRSARLLAILVPQGVLSTRSLSACLPVENQLMSKDGRQLSI